MGWGSKRRIRELRISRKRRLRALKSRRRFKARRTHLGRYGVVSLPPETRQRAVGSRPDYQLTFPTELDFDGAFDNTLNFFSELRKLVDRVKPKSIRIDHSALEKVSPAAALVLIAEVIRGTHILPNCKWRGNEAANKDVHELLGEVGYWQYFKGMNWVKSKTNSRQYLQHRTGNRTSGQTAKELVQHFLPELLLPEESKKTLYPAIIECMDNVMKHAYQIRDKLSYHYNRWWLLGFRDPVTHEVFFCFYDHGLGIPKTIRVRLKDMLGPLSDSDARLITKAVVEGHYSSTKDPTRGRGLPALKRFIDTAKSGELVIVSHKSRCSFSKNCNDEKDFSTRFEGTLVVWRLQN